MSRGNIAGFTLALGLFFSVLAMPAVAIDGPFLYDGLGHHYEQDYVWRTKCTTNSNRGGDSIPWSTSQSASTTVTTDYGFSAAWYCEAHYGSSTSSTVTVTDQVSGSVHAPPANAPEGAHIDHHAWMAYTADYDKKYVKYQYWTIDDLVSGWQLMEHAEIASGYKIVTCDSLATYKQDEGGFGLNNCPRPCPYILHIKREYVTPDQLYIPKENVGTMYYTLYQERDWS